MKNYYNLLEENKNILVIDTSLVVTNKLKNQLEKIGFSVFIANNIATVHKYLEEDYILFFGIICEIDMPKVENKLEFLKYLNCRCSSIIVLSSNNDESFIHDILSYDIIDYILKSKEEDLVYATQMMERIYRYKNYKILLLEENLINQNKIKKHLENLMLKVLICNNIQQSLTLIKKHKDICLVLVNKLEQTNTNKIITKIRKEYTKDDLNIIAIVNKENNEESSSALKYGANAYIYDDLSKEQVCLVVNNLLDVYENKAFTNNIREQIESYTTKLSKYVSPQIYQSIIKDLGNNNVESKTKKLTIFFSDIVNFTKTTESLESEELTSMLNSYLIVMSDIALKYGATIDKYIGDAIMIFFGDPFSKGIKEDAIACVKMAIEMQNRMESFREEQKINAVVNPFHIRIGIATGNVTVGNFGSNERMDYTILGKYVNLASTLEASSAHDEILIAQETNIQIKNVINTVIKEKIDVTGFHEKIQPYEVVRTKSNKEVSDEINITLKASLKNMDRKDIVLDFDTKKLLNKLQGTDNNRIEEDSI